MARLIGAARPADLLNSPLPQALFIAVMLLIELTGNGRRIDNLRLWYGVGITVLFGGMYWLARRRGTSFPAWVTAVLFAYVAFEVLVPAFPFYRGWTLLNRFEHFTGFAVLTLFVLLFAQMMLPRPVVGRGLLLIFALVWSVGLGNEIIEYILYGPRLFLSRDTATDLVMNTAAITLVLLIAPRFLGSRNDIGGTTNDTRL